MYGDFGSSRLLAPVDHGYSPAAEEYAEEPCFGAPRTTADYEQASLIRPRELLQILNDRAPICISFSTCGLVLAQSASLHNLLWQPVSFSDSPANFVGIIGVFSPSFPNYCLRPFLHLRNDLVNLSLNL